MGLHLTVRRRLMTYLSHLSSTIQWMKKCVLKTLFCPQANISIVDSLLILFARVKLHPLDYFVDINCVIFFLKWHLGKGFGKSYLNALELTNTNSIATFLNVSTIEKYFKAWWKNVLIRQIQNSLIVWNISLSESGKSYKLFMHSPSN